MPTASLTHENIAIAPEVQPLPIRRQRRALFHARGVDGVAEIARRRPWPCRPPRIGDVHVLLSLGGLAVTPSGPIGAENHLEAAVVALAHVRHDVLELGADPLHDRAGAEFSVRSE